jgi:hypothetical protein
LIATAVAALQFGRKFGKAGEVLAGLSALKTAFDIAKGLKDIDDATKRSAAVIELQEKILSAQQEQFALTEQLRGLQNKMATLDTWEAEKNRYELTDFGGETLAYALKQSMANGEPPHRLCSACYQNRKKGILQPTGISAYKQEMVKCSECGKDFMLGNRVERPLSARSKLPSGW